MNFDNHDETLLKFGKSVCFLIIKKRMDDGSIIVDAYGTAFFVARNMLLTAGHNTYTSDGQPINRVHIAMPGLHQVDLLDIQDRKIPTLECEVIGRLNKRRQWNASHDLAVLKGSFDFPDYLILTHNDIQNGDVVDILGYPGFKMPRWISLHKTGDTKRSLQEAEELLPQGKLVVSRGRITDIQETISYH